MSIAQQINEAMQAYAQANIFTQAFVFALVLMGFATFVVWSQNRSLKRQDRTLDQQGQMLNNQSAQLATSAQNANNFTKLVGLMEGLMDETQSSKTEMQAAAGRMDKAAATQAETQAQIVKTLDELKAAMQADSEVDRKTLTELDEKLNEALKLLKALTAPPTPPPTPEAEPQPPVPPALPPLPAGAGAVVMEEAYTEGKFGTSRPVPDTDGSKATVKIVRNPFPDKLNAPSGFVVEELSDTRADTTANGVGARDMLAVALPHFFERWTDYIAEAVEIPQREGSFWNRWNVKSSDKNTMVVLNFEKLEGKYRANVSTQYGGYAVTRPLTEDYAIEDARMHVWDAEVLVRGDKTGFVRLWLDGTLLFDVQGIQTNVTGEACDTSVNNYSKWATTLSGPVTTYCSLIEVRAAL